MTDKEIWTAHGTWYAANYKHWEADTDVHPYLNTDPSGPWLAKARKAHFLTSPIMAKRLGIAKQTYLQLERAEKTGNITLRALRECAEAMGCDLVYALRPKTKKYFSRQIWDALYAAVKDDHRLAYADKRRGYKLYGFALQKMQQPKFRREMGWGNNINYDVE